MRYNVPELDDAGAAFAFFEASRVRRSSLSASANSERKVEPNHTYVSRPGSYNSKLEKREFTRKGFVNQTLKHSVAPFKGKIKWV
jgi:hypothetical protein